MDELLKQKLLEAQKIIETPGTPISVVADLGHSMLLTMILVELREIKDLLAAKP